MRTHTTVATLFLLCASAVCGAAPTAAPTAPAAPMTGDPAAWVDQKVADCAPKPEERRFDQTGWLTDIRSALALAKQHHRPVFLFTHDGRMGLGRC
jgi:hypothetical protein